MKRLLIIVAIALAFALGIWMASATWFPWQKQKTEIEATALLERIEAVSKLVTVDGYFSEVYDYKDYYGYDWGIFRKKALIRVKAKVSAGYDLSHIDVEAIPDRKHIVIRRLPQPAILSIDHDLDYYDLREGTFNAFSNEDLTKLADQAKDYIGQTALDSDLLKQAEQRGQHLLQTLRFMVESSGWTLSIEQSAIDSKKLTKDPLN